MPKNLQNPTMLFEFIMKNAKIMCFMMLHSITFPRYNEILQCRL